MSPAGSESLERFKLLASAIAGRVVEVAPAERGSRAWTDGTTIFVDADASRLAQLQCVGVQASLLGAESFDTEVIGRLGKRPTQARRYLAVEGHRALAAQTALLPVSVVSLVDLSVAERSESPAASLAIAKSRDAIADPPEAFGEIRPGQVRAPVQRSVAGRAPDHTPRRQREDLLRELDDGQDDDRPVLDFLSSPVGGGGPIGRLLKKLFGDARSQTSGPPGADVPTHWTRHGARVARRNAAVTTTTAPALDDATVADQRGTKYREWDVFRRGYRPDWCTVIELSPKQGHDSGFTPPDAHALRRPLARLGMDLDRRHRQLQGDEVDIDATVEAFVEAAAGSAPDEAIYVDTLRCRRELAVLVLLDVSGSAAEPGVVRATVHEHQRATAAALTLALHDLGDRVALYAFRSQGRSAVEVLPVKRFNDELDALVWRRLGSLIPSAYTRLGAAIRHGTTILERDGGTSRRLLVVVSDGFAYDHGYEPAYGEADARRALAEARRRGTGCLCLSVGASTDAEALRRVFGTAAHATVPREEQLPGVVRPLFRSALRSAEIQRLAWQRTERTRERLQIDERRTA